MCRINEHPPCPLCGEPLRIIGVRDPRLLMADAFVCDACKTARVVPGQFMARTVDMSFARPTAVVYNHHVLGQYPRELSFTEDLTRRVSQSLNNQIEQFVFGHYHLIGTHLLAYYPQALQQNGIVASQRVALIPNDYHGDAPFEKLVELGYPHMTARFVVTVNSDSVDAGATGVCGCGHLKCWHTFTRDGRDKGSVCNADDCDCNTYRVP